MSAALVKALQGNVADHFGCGRNLHGMSQFVADVFDQFALDLPERYPDTYVSGAAREGNERQTRTRSLARTVAGLDMQNEIALFESATQSPER